MPESIETLIVGGGQAGLAASYFLKQRGRENLILDKAARAADAWRNQRWDSFTLVTPNLSFSLPGAEYQGSDPKGYMHRDEIVRRFEDYIHEKELPIQYNVEVHSIQAENGTGRYLVQTPGRQYRAHNVIVANGWFREGKIPQFAQKIPPTILQMHSASYRNPQSLPPGAVLVVGAAQTGAQIAEELYQSGRRVFLSTGGAPRAPRRYRGRDIFVWLRDLGFFERPIEMFAHLPDRKWVAPQVTGRDGGHTLNLHQFHRSGVILLGHTRDYIDGYLILANDLKENLAKSDQGEKFIVSQINEFIQKSGQDAPEEQLPALTDGYQAPEITSLDLKAEGINSIIWACGFQYDCALVRMPILDEFGYPKTRGGVSDYPGLYFMGIPFQSNLKSGLIFGVEDNAAYIAQHIDDNK